MDTDKLLKGQVALITGAGRGIGAVIAAELGAAGAIVAIAEIDPATGQDRADQLRGLGIEANYFPVDVSKSSSVDQCVDEVVQTCGRLDIVVNNAGVSGVGPHIQDTSDDNWNRSIAVMQTGVFNMMRSASRYFLPQESGVIINISSIRGFSPNPGRIAYCAAKAAVLMMTRVAAAEWAGHGIRVNAIAPGVMDTPMWQNDVQAGIIDEDEYKAKVPMGTIGDPQQLGRLVTFLCSDSVPYMTGATLTVDGALTSVPLG